MSNKSSTASQVIALPKGGGALSGLGETFSPDLQSGTGNFAVPISLPPGRNGMQPQLQLAYSTGAGNGLFGLGWGVGVPSVSRKTAKGVPQYRDNAPDLDERDTFILSGAEDLVPVGGAGGHTRYRPRTEGLFARIERHQDAGNDYWVLRTKDGLRSTYGTPASAGADPAAVADPADRARVFDWKLTSTVDTFGNQVVYEYERDTGEGDGHAWDQLYLKRIRYADYRDAAGGETRFLVTVSFDYGDPLEERPDPYSSYRAGFEIRTRRRCRRILVATHAESERLLRSYELDYQTDPHNGVSLLKQILVRGHDGARSETLPPLRFSYTNFAPEGRTFAPITGPLPASSLAGPNLELVDLFGSGLPDILELGDTARYWRNQGNGRFDQPRPMPEAPAGLRLADPGVQLIDANGDGQPDLLVSGERQAGYFPLRLGGLWDRRSFQPYATAPSFDLEDPAVRLVDLDGDGVTDAIRSGSRLECFFNHPQRGWDRLRLVERRSLEVFPNLDFADPRVKLADMSGDGLQALVLIHDGSVAYWPNLGHGNWGRRITMGNSPRLPYGYDPRRLLLGDVDGDGLADLVYIDQGKVLLWINQHGNRWSDPITIRGTPPVADIDSVRLVDLLGSGISGVLWSADAGSRARHQMYYLDFTGGVKPYLLDELDNQSGTVTRVAYAPSTRFYLADQQRPATRWKTTLPFPVQVVARVEVVDALSGGKLTTEYAYHHGYWDGAEREFRGFGRVDQRDTEELAEYHAPGLHGGRAFAAVAEQRFSPPTETRTWFHQGPIGDEFGGWEEIDYRDEYWPGDPPRIERPAAMTGFLAGLPRRDRRDALRTLRGSLLRSELYARDGDGRQDRPYTVGETLMGLREESPRASHDGQRPRIFFPHPLAQRTTQWERGDDPMTNFTIHETYDQYGQPCAQVSIAVPRGRAFAEPAPAGQPYLATQALTDYAQADSDQLYIVDRVARSTSYEIVNDGSLALPELLAGIRDGSAERRVIGQTLAYYDGDAFTGLPLGQVGPFGAPTRGETLVLTDEQVRAAYQDDAGAPALPPYLDPSGPAVWSDDYPQAFREAMPPLAGYSYHADADHAPGYFVTTSQRYDFHDEPNRAGRGLLKITRDALGHDTAIAYDSYDLLPTHVTDAAGLITQASYDYRVLQPRQVIDPNGNRASYSFTALGLLESSAVMGKPGEQVGDTPEVPSIRLVYDFLAFAERGQPISVRTIKRVHHALGGDVPPAERDKTVEVVEYSDGFGRLLQTRTQAEDVIFGDLPFGGAGLPADQNLAPGDALGQERGPGDGPRVVVSGWQIYDNKGRAIEKYEPFFADGWEYRPPVGSQFGQKVQIFYDPRGQVVRTLNPDGSEQRMILGTPLAMNDPEQFMPSPWESYTYDPNDNAKRTHGSGDQAHWDTPTTVVHDALGRAVKAIERNGADPADWYTTRSTYDIQGNLLTVADALGRVAFHYHYDLLNRPLRIENGDAGTRRVVLDALGNQIEQRDSKGALALQRYDLLARPTHGWARDAAAEAVTLRSRMIYGDSAEVTLGQAGNLLGKLYQQYDEAGRLTIEAYDFKGNALEKQRQVIGDSAILSVFPKAGEQAPDWRINAFRVDWQPAQGSTLADLADKLLDPTKYQTSAGYDALNRVTTLRYPQDVEGKRKELRLHANHGGELERVELDGAAFVERIAYDARGRRALIAYGNGVMTRYAYDPQTLRLARMRSERYSNPVPLTYHGLGKPLQEYGYAYDLAGNITGIHDRAPGSGIPGSIAGPDALDRSFGYDPLYRLRSATGRECDRPRAPQPWEESPRCTDPTRTRGYREEYRYDPLGNMLELHHQAGGEGFTRQFALAAGGNRLETLTIGATTYGYRYDASGNLLGEETSRHFEWDHGDRMKAFRTQAGTSEPSVHAHYLYGADGQRVKKLVRKQGGLVEVTVYIDGIFEHHRTIQATSTQENNTLHVMDDQRRIALVRIGRPFAGDATPAVKYHLGDHLGGSNVVLDQAGNLINREEYTPYGETSFGSFAKKRYRFGGKERDEESGLYYHGARYYAPWLARWANCDPAGMVDGLNMYGFVRGNPLLLVDPSGMQSEPEISIPQPPPASAVDTIKPAPTLTAKEAADGAHTIAGQSDIAGGVVQYQSDSVDKTIEELGDERKEQRAERRQQDRKDGKKHSGRAKGEGGNSKQRRAARRARAAEAPARKAQRQASVAVAGRLAHAQRAAKVLRGVGAGLNVVGTAATATEQYLTSPTQTTVGRVTDTTAAAGLSLAFGVAQPYFAAADAVLDSLTDGEVSLGNTTQNSLHAITTLGEGVITGDTRGMQTFHERSLKGEYGTVFRKASEAGEEVAFTGDYWGEYGFVDGGGRFLKEVWNAL